jgi:uncharacterized membrane protein YdjX (TVP38/TMEM64 family)
MRSAGPVIAIGIIAALCCAIWCLPVERWTLGFTAWLNAAGWVGAVVYLLAFVLGSLVFLPGLPLVLAAGFAYGPLLGFAIALPAATAAAASTFGMGRHLGRDWVERHLRHHPRFRTLDQATERRGFRLVVLLRLSPVVPFSLLGYLMGVSRISFRDFVLASTLGKTPSLVLYIYLASVVPHVSELKAARAEPSAEVLYWVGLVVTLLAVWQLARFARSETRHLLVPKS